MPSIVVSTVIDAAVETVWAAVSDLASHVEWMSDAETISVAPPGPPGPGTTMAVATRIGPFRTTDRMEVTEWEPLRAIGVSHRGVVSGRGRFELSPVAGGTRFTWIEELRFPLWLGGAVTAWCARPVLAWVWRRNLASLRRLVEM